MHNSGPRTETWGIPYISFSEVKFAPFILVYWFRLTKNDLNQSLVLPLYHSDVILKEEYYD